MEENVRLTMLMDFYGALLTDRQREALSLHLEEDLSFSEIALEMGISRQGAADAAGAARDMLRHYEEKLNMLAKHVRNQEMMDRAVRAAEKLDGSEEILRILGQMREEEEHGV